MNWKINTFLPDIVQENFTVKWFIAFYRFFITCNLSVSLILKTLIAGYLGSVYDVVKDYVEKMLANKSSQISVMLQNLF